ncbi:hypothetical protein RRG08_027718 [Elysia crispata]|uniref:Uncharacterized protein n=1 Tax=Elysia crispata TaxID=231223 RepID=A0AAE0XNB8_9GAST|nr:hypothetical protein RRG08_027718 [Elysia crispata]
MKLRQHERDCTLAGETELQLHWVGQGTPSCRVKLKLRETEQDRAKTPSGRDETQFSLIDSTLFRRRDFEGGLSSEFGHCLYGAKSHMTRMDQQQDVLEPSGLASALLHPPLPTPTSTPQHDCPVPLLISPVSSGLGPGLSECRSLLWPDPAARDRRAGMGYSGTLSV